MTDPYCRKHGHWDCPKCGNKEVAGDLISRLTLKLSEAREFIEAVKSCRVCSACQVKAEQALEGWEEGNK